MQWTFIKVLKDNYVWVLYNANKEAIIIDCGDSQVVKSFLDNHHLTLKYILLTHSHYDHKDGIKELQAATNALVVGNKNYAQRLPKLDIAADYNQELVLLEQKLAVLNTAGHCADHISYYFNDLKMLFCGDCVFSLGCGRIFEGTPKEMINSFNLLKRLPKESLVFPGHEYTKSNLIFTKSLDFFNLEERENFILNNEVTLPSTWDFELKCNPFLNLDNKSFQRHIENKEGLTEGAMSDQEKFLQRLRFLKNAALQ
ncbi:Hydroxyacylglutathione hydrolase [Candidatus Hepatincolaceae symbiont of Richtersius coronifer]